MTFEDQLRVLIFFHFQDCTFVQNLFKVLEENNFVGTTIAPEKGIKKSSFAKAFNTQGLEQLAHLYQLLQTQDVSILPQKHNKLENVIGVDGPLIDACHSIH
jgi:hypothetical protein